MFNPELEPTEEVFKYVRAPIKFISCEPLEEKVVFSDLGIFNWLIIGGRNESSEMSRGQPERGWVRSLLEQAEKANVKVFCRANLLAGSKEEKPKEYPVEVRSPRRSLEIFFLNLAEIIISFFWSILMREGR